MLTFCKSFPNNDLKTGVTGIEPAISGLTGRRDNQLRYTPRSLCDGLFVPRNAAVCQLFFLHQPCFFIGPGIVSAFSREA